MVQTQRTQKLGPGPSPGLGVTPRPEPSHTVLWIRGSPRGGPLSLSLCPRLSPPISPALDRGRRPGLVLLGGGGGTRPGSVCSGVPLLGRSFQDRTALCGWDDGQARWRLRGRSQESGGRDPSGACCYSMSGPKGQGRVTQGRASLHCPKLEA